MSEPVTLEGTDAPRVNRRRPRRGLGKFDAKIVDSSPGVGQLLLAWGRVHRDRWMPEPKT
jgi:hypothetical protein